MGFGRWSPAGPWASGLKRLVIPPFGRVRRRYDGTRTMLRKEQNDLLCQTGPGTPMGQMFRLSWQPALLAEDLPENECPPVRVKLLGERLPAWRDTQGNYATTDEFCAHRGVSLWIGRHEHN